jgi:hypothetical protein
VFSCLSGVLGIFDFRTVLKNPENDHVSIIKPRWIFYENPFSDQKVKIRKEILTKLKIKKYADRNIKKNALWKSCFKGVISPKTRPDVIVRWRGFHCQKPLREFWYIKTRCGPGCTSFPPNPGF